MAVACHYQGHARGGGIPYCVALLEVTWAKFLGLWDTQNLSNSTRDRPKREAASHACAQNGEAWAFPPPTRGFTTTHLLTVLHRLTEPFPASNTLSMNGHNGII